MADVKISDLAADSSPESTALIEIETAGGLSRKITLAQVLEANAASSHTHALGDITQSGAASGQVATWNGTAWVPQTPSGGGSPGGSGSELQYRGGASTFGGASGTHWDAVNGRLSIGAGTSPAGMVHAQASAASVIPAVLQGAASQTAALQEWRNSAGAVLGKVMPGSSGVYLYLGASAFIYSDNGSRLSLNPSGAAGYGTALISSAVFELDRDVHFGFAAGVNHASAADTRLTRVAAGVLGVRGSSGTAGAAIGLVEQAAPSAPSANGVHVYAEDNGSGKTRIVAMYSDGSTDVISLQP